MRLALISALILLSASFSFAQTPAPKALPTSRPVMERVVNDDLVLLELEMADSGYSINKSLESATRLLTVIEKVLTIRCLSEVQASLGQSNPSQDEVCIDFANRAMDIDPGNVVAICVINGIDSSICKAASEGQVLATYDPKAEEKNQTASLEDVVAVKKEGDKVRIQTIQLENKIKYLGVNNKNPLTLSEKKSLMGQILNLNCVRPRIKLLELNKKTIKSSSTRVSRMVAPDNESETGEESNPKSAGTPDAFDQMLKDHFKTPTPTVEIPKSARVYEVTTKCKNYLDEAFKLDPYMAAAFCHKWGFYSWQCINSKRREGLKSSSKKEDSFTRPTGQIQKF